MTTIDAGLARKLSRMACGLAPEDDCLAQAEHTAVLRGEPGYAERWLAWVHATTTSMADEPCDTPAACITEGLHHECTTCGYAGMCHAY